MQENGNYTIMLKGSRADIEQIPHFMQSFCQALKVDLNCTVFNQQVFQSHTQIFADAAKKALAKSSGHEIVFSVKIYEDVSGPFSDLLQALKEKFPQLAVSGLARYQNETSSENRLFYSAASNPYLDVNSQKDSDPIPPQETWIPQAWRNPGTAPFSQAEGQLSLLGNWGNPEKLLLENSLSDSHLLADLGFEPLYPDKPAIVIRPQYYAFSLSGTADIAAILFHLSASLYSYYTGAQKYLYREFCRIMREKKLFIHLRMERKADPDLYWEYRSSAAYHFIISSDGTNLHTNFTWSAAYSYSSDINDYAPILYKMAVGSNLSAEPEAAQLLYSRTIHRFIKEHPLSRSTLRAFEKLKERKTLQRLRELTNKEEIANLVVFMNVKDYLEHLTPYIEKEQKIWEQVKELELYPSSPVLLVPKHFDSRFENQNFFVKGKLEGCTVSEVEKIITQFGGKIVHDFSSADYFIYGQGIGDPFKSGFEQGIQFLSIDYFQDMIQ